ncbi:hypothetical protein AAE478_001093 [Parahypoxylon ruwenzoriense]
MPIIKPRAKSAGPAGRVLGLSARQKPARLLSRIGGRDTHTSESSDAEVKVSRSVKIEDPESITAPPQSSDDDDYRKLRQRSCDSSQDSDGDEKKNQRADIKPTVFSNAQQTSSQLSNAQRSIRGRSKSSSQGKRGIGGSQNDEPPSSAGSKRSAEDDIPQLGSHLKDELGFTGAAFKKNKTSVRRATTYGGKSSQPRSSQLKSSQKPGPRSSALQPDAESPPHKAFKRFVASPTPDSPRPTPAGGFVKPESLSPERATPSTAFVNPPSSVGSTPWRGQPRPEFRRGRTLSDESPVRPKFKPFNPDEDTDAAAETIPPSSQRPNRANKPRRPKVKTRRNEPEPVSEVEFSQRPAFKLHALDDLDCLDDSDHKVVTTSENRASDDEAGDITIESPVAVTARCPMCREVVDADLLAKYSDRGRMNIRKQAAFCRLHKRESARSSRTEKGYPKIKWRSLDSRCEEHQGFLKDILEGTRPSHYYNVLRENVESGKNRTLLKTDDSLTPGYYGPRGLRAMTEYIMRTLSSVVRKRAVEDRLVSARGYTGYVQAVLVPELAVRLIMEDMKVTEEDARKIMQDSIEVGELLYEDAGDIIAGVSDEEGDI